MAFSADIEITKTLSMCFEAFVKVVNWDLLKTLKYGLQDLVSSIYFSSLYTTSPFLIILVPLKSIVVFLDCSKKTLLANDTNQASSCASEQRPSNYIIRRTMTCSHSDDDLQSF